MHAEQDTEAGQIGAAVQRIMASQYQPKVGDRVRVLARPECRVSVGTVAERLSGKPARIVGYSDSADGHSWKIKFDDPRMNRLGGPGLWWSCAAELERVEP